MFLTFEDHEIMVIIVCPTVTYQNQLAGIENKDCLRN
jgi:hypothetical protein